MCCDAAGVVLQSQLKDAQLSASEATRTQAELAGKIKELERKIKNLDGDIAQAQDVRDGERKEERGGGVERERGWGEKERFTPLLSLGCLQL